MTPIAVLDANVLFPMYLRDTLLRVASAGCFRAHWSGRILDEMTRNLVDQHRMAQAQADRLKSQMKVAFPEAKVEDWEPLEALMPNDPKDRHVTAAAMQIGADLIVTHNLKDFRDLPHGLRARTPDAFLLDLFNAMPERILAALNKQASGYRNPPADFGTLLKWLEADIPNFVATVRDAISASNQVPDQVPTDETGRNPSLE